MIIKVLETLFPVGLLIGLGMLCKRTGILSSDTVSGLKKLVTHLFLPVLVFDTMAHASLGADSLLLFGCSVAFHLILFGVARKVRHHFGENAQLYPYMIECYECGMIGYALIGALVGTEHLAPVAVLDIGSCIFGFTILTNGLMLLTGEKKEHGILYQVLHTPTFVALLAGIAAGVTGAGAWIETLPVSGIYTNSVELVTAPLTPVILLCIGYDLRFEKDALGDIFRVALSRIGMSVLFFAITAGLCLAFTGMDRTLLVTLIMYFALPPTFLVPMYVKEEKQARFVAGYLSVAIIFSLIVFAVLCIFA